MSDTVDLFNRSVDEFDRRVQMIKDDQWENPTPCSEWNVRDLVNHLVNEDRWAPDLMAGKTIAEVGDAYDGDLLGNDPVGAWSDASAKARASIGEPGAMDRTVHVSFGDISGREYTGQLWMDHLIHAWDLARGIGQDDKLDPELVDLCFAMAKPMEEIFRGSGLYGDHVDIPEDADPQTQLLALVGRKS